jgi:hypothetical protein
MACTNQGDARIWLLASVIPVRHFPWFENGPDESLPLLSIPLAAAWGFVFIIGVLGLCI